MSALFTQVSTASWRETFSVKKWTSVVRVAKTSNVHGFTADEYEGYNLHGLVGKSELVLLAVPVDLTG